MFFIIVKNWFFKNQILIFKGQNFVFLAQILSKLLG